MRQLFLLFLAHWPLLPRGYDGVDYTPYSGPLIFTIPDASAYNLTTGCRYPGCEAGAPCTALNASTCASGLCSGGGCLPPTCSDGVRNGWEMLQDCGGVCPHCDLTQASVGCLSPHDCASAVCAFPNGYATIVQQYDRMQAWDNGGGRCALPRATDGEQNGQESDIDCGVALCDAYKVKSQCPYLCRDGFKCNALQDCANSVCFGQEQETVVSLGAGGIVLSPMFCVPVALSSLNPAIGARIRGGVRLRGVDKRTLNFPALAAAVARMIDVDAATVLPEVLLNEYTDVQVGNASYMDVRLKYGWQPAAAYPAARRQRQRALRRSSPAPHYASLPSAAPGGGWVRQGALFHLDLEDPALPRIAPDNSSYWDWDQGAGLNEEGGSALSRPRGLALAPGAWTQRNRPFAPYNLSLTDLVNATRVRWLVYVGDYETTLLQSRMAQLHTLKLLPGGWPAERAVQRALNWIAQDAEYCEWYGRSFALPLFNMTGVNCTKYLNCTVLPAVPGRVDGEWETAMADGSSVSSQYAYNETQDSTVVTQCTTPASAAKAFPALAGVQWQTTRARRGSAGGDAPLQEFHLRPSSDPSWVQSEYVTARLREWVLARCTPLWHAADHSLSGALPGALEAAEAADPHAAALCPQRMLAAPARNASLAPRALRAPTLSPISPIQLFSQTSYAAGLLPEAPRYDLVDLLAPGIPRGDFAAGLAGLAYDAGRGPIFLQPGASADTSTFGRGPPDKPSAYLVPAGLRVLVDPRGTPRNLLVRDAPFPIQPILDLVDRHGRHVAQWQGSVEVSAFIDASLFPAELFAAGSPSPSPTKGPLLGTHYTEPSVLQLQLYPDNMLVQLRAVPLTLQGKTAATLDPATGLASFSNLYVTRIVRGLIINFTAVFTTKQLNMRITLNGASRPFDVLPPPPQPLVLITRFILPPGVTYFLIALAAAAIIYGITRVRLLIKGRQTRRSDMKLRQGGVDREGERAVAGADGLVQFTPRPTLLDWLPFRYVFGLLPLGLRKLLKRRGTVKITWDTALHPDAEEVAAKLAAAQPAPVHLHSGAGLRPVSTGAVAAFDAVDSLLRLQMAPPTETAKERRKREREEEKEREARRIARGVDLPVEEAPPVGMDSAARARAAAAAQGPAAAPPALPAADALASSILGELSPINAALAASAAAAAEAQAAAAAAAARAALEEENKRFSVRLGGAVLFSGTLPVFLRKPLPPPAGGAGGAAAAQGIRGAPTPAPKPKRRLSMNSVLLALHARFTVGGAGLDPVSKLPIVSRSLDVKDEPPPDAGTQAAQHLAQFEKEARARAMGLHSRSKTRTQTRASHAAVSAAGGGAGGSGAGEVVYPEAGDVPGVVPTGRR